MAGGGLVGTLLSPPVSCQMNGDFGRQLSSLRPPPPHFETQQSN